MRRPVALLSTLAALTACAPGAMPPRLASARPPGDAEAQASRRPPAQEVQIRFRSEASLQALTRRGLDLFEDVDLSHRTVGARVTPAQAAALRRAGYEVVEVARTEDLEEGFPKGYRSVEAVHAELKALTRQAPDVARLTSIGQSLEGRDLPALRLTAAPGAPRVLYYAGEHARELPPVEVTMDLAWHLVRGWAAQDPTVRELLTSREVWVLPLLNPDGRVRVQDGDAMWRKNARPNADGSVGVDLNRNHDNHWTMGNARPGDEDFRGPAALSEPEAVALGRFMGAQRFLLCVDIHSFAGMVLWPPGYTKQFSPAEAALGRLGRPVANRLAYKAGPIARLLYQVSGDSSTWVHEAHGTLAYTVELDDRGFHPAIGAARKDFEDWRWPLIWMALRAKDPASAELNLPPEPRHFAGLGLRL
ncbi:MAG: M14 family zinc carboxypeptidase [Candidatus Sericytochromatia bacterium]|nr:M14 family zinc carboxypeptidase [Candidatus Sericytochromatia bacterium]